jgi:hypothetical protein
VELKFQDASPVFDSSGKAAAVRLSLCGEAGRLLAQCDESMAGALTFARTVAGRSAVVASRAAKKTWVLNRANDASFQLTSNFLEEPSEASLVP